jgi:hypothetical protein
MLSFQPAHEGVWMASLGDIEASGETMFYFGDHTSVSRKYLVPRDAALEVVRIWWEKGVLARSIQWTTEIF